MLQNLAKEVANRPREAFNLWRLNIRTPVDTGKDRLKGE
jgi:hypothetical protein